MKRKMNCLSGSVTILKRNRHAFSLVEMLIAVGLVGLFSTMVFRMFGDSTSNQQRAMADLNMQSRVLSSQNRIVRMVREGTDFIIPEVGEAAPALFFSDFSGNIQVLYQVKDQSLSKKSGKDLFKLMHYQVDVKKFNPDNPIYDPAMSSVVAENIKDISFLVTNANTVNVTANFATENREFQTMFEVGLLNTGAMQ
jgi:prepilin-type N-terminal cleavage/methylation domain-containing protein